MLNKIIEKEQFVQTVSSLTKDKLTLADVITCYELTDGKCIDEPLIDNQTVVNEILKNQPNGYEENPSNTDSIVDTPYVDLNKLIFEKPSNDDVSNKYDNATQTSNATPKPKTLNRIKDPRYRDVVLGKISYVQYMEENPSLKHRMQMQSLLKRIHGYRGFGVTVPNFDRLSTFTFLLFYKQNARKALAICIEPVLENTKPFVDFINKGLEILSDEEMELRDTLHKILPNVKLGATLWSVLTILYNFSVNGYSKESVLYTLMRPISFYQKSFRSARIIDAVVSFRKTSTYKCLKSLEPILLKIIEDINNGKYVQDDSRDMKSYAEYISIHVSNILEYIEFIDCEDSLTKVGEKECETLVCSNLGDRLAYAITRNRKWMIDTCWYNYHSRCYEPIMKYCEELDNRTGSCLTPYWMSLVSYEPTREDVDMLLERVEQHKDKLKKKL